MNITDVMIQDPYFKRFYDRPRSSPTKTRAKTAMCLYLQFYKEVKNIETTPTELLQRKVSDNKKPVLEQGEIERDWNEFVDWLENTYKKQDRHRKKSNKALSSTSVKGYSGMIKTFFSESNCPLSKKAELPRKIKSSSGRIENLKIEYRPNSVKKLISVMESNRDKAITLVMFQSGMDISTLLSLTYGHIKNEYEAGECPLLIKLTREKIGLNYRTFIGRDAIEAIKIYLKERTAERYICKDCGASWENKRNTCTLCKSTNIKPYCEKLSITSPLFIPKRKSERMVRSNFEKALRKYAILAGLVDEEQMKEADINPGRPHALRSGFSSILSLKGVNQKIIDGMMGHVDAYGGAYTQFSDEELREIYGEKEQFLSISEVREISDIQEKMDDKFGEVYEYIESLKSENEKQKEEIKSIKAGFNHSNRLNQHFYESVYGKKETALSGLSDHTVDLLFFLENLPEQYYFGGYQPLGEMKLKNFINVLKLSYGGSETVAILEHLKSEGITDVDYGALRKTIISLDKKFIHGWDCVIHDEEYQIFSETIGYYENSMTWKKNFRDIVLNFMMLPHDIQSVKDIKGGIMEVVSDKKNEHLNIFDLLRNSRQTKNSYSPMLKFLVRMKSQFGDELISIYSNINAALDDCTELWENIDEFTMKIKHGLPLKGTCSLCA